MPRSEFRTLLFTLLGVIILSCSTKGKQYFIMDVNGLHVADTNDVWLSHEHILVDFIGAKDIDQSSWDHDIIINIIFPYLDTLSKFNVDIFVDATPNFLGRDPILLKKIADSTGLRIITNTGLYGARNDKYIPDFAKNSSVEDLAKLWISEFENGISGTSVKPGFIKIGIDNSNPLSAMHEKLVRAAAHTHLNTGLTIASHTGKAEGLWPQLEILTELDVNPDAFIWIHAQKETNNNNYLEAAKIGCWISLDGLGWELDNHIEKLMFAKENGILDKILISHDAGWYDPQKEIQTIKPYTVIFKKLYHELKSRGFTDEEFNKLISVNPTKAFSIEVKSI